MIECARVKSMRANNLTGTTNFVTKIFDACSLKVCNCDGRGGAGVEKENMYILGKGCPIANFTGVSWQIIRTYFF